ncbi:MAG TPA: hypothetical protein VGB91_09990 [Rhizomicrobium sp.]
MTDDTNRLAKTLSDRGYAALLGQHPDGALVEAIKAEPDIAARLADIVNDRAIAWQARFIASEFLFRYVDMVLQNGCDRAGLQDSYFQALRHNYTGNGVDWGFGTGPDDIGILGRMVIGWGKDSAAFAPGLDDEGHLTMNFPSRTPLHFRPPYRVKDFAALILAKARGAAIDLAGSPEDRDRAIAGLKKALAANG